jgi:large subunit ribosomal protein L29
MKPSELRGMTLEDLRLKVEDLSKELFNLRVQHVRGQLENPMKIPQIRKDIARTKTIIAEKRTEKRV